MNFKLERLGQPGGKTLPASFEESSNLVPACQVVEDLQQDARILKSSVPISDDYLSLDRDELCLFDRGENVVVLFFKLSERIVYIADGKNESFEPALQSFVRARWSLSYQQIDIQPVLYPMKTKLGCCAGAARYIGKIFLMYNKFNISSSYIVKPSRSCMSSVERSYHKFRGTNYYPVSESLVSNQTFKGLRYVGITCSGCGKRRSLSHGYAAHYRSCVLKKAKIDRDLQRESEGGTQSIDSS